jgi:NADPH:quinone reductase-like Zn-dependent oxidoreductase
VPLLLASESAPRAVTGAGAITDEYLETGDSDNYRGRRVVPRAVRFDAYGGVDVLRVVDVERPVPSRGEVLVSVKAAGINPGEAKIREGLHADRFPATFPSGQGSDLAGVVEELGPGVDRLAVGDGVLGFTDQRASQAELVTTPADHLVHRPSGVSWEVAGSLFVVGSTAYAAVRAVGASDGDKVVVSGAAGGVGSLAVQLARHAGATVIGLASEPNHQWLADHGVVPVSYGEGVADRVRATAGAPADAFVDTVGDGYVGLALDLGVQPDRIDTIVDFDARRKYGVKTDGNAVGARAEVLEELAGLISRGLLEVPIARVYPLSAVADAYRDLANGHTRGKIVLVP